MKIKNKKVDYDEVAAMSLPEHKKPKRPSLVFRTLLKVVSLPELWATHFKCRRVGMERLGKHEPALILMNHSSFIDLKIAASALYPRPFNIVSTLDAFIGKEWLMRNIGCIPTRKFVADIGLVKDISHCIKKNNTSVLMYPEAGYSFDGRSTVLPDSLAALVKRLGVPLVMLEAFGAYHRDPLYNNLQKRKVRVSAEIRYVLSPEDIAQMSKEQIAEVITREFSFDNFRRQQQQKIRIDEPFRADGLHRVLYKCPKCGAEGKTEGKGELLRCSACGKAWRLDEYGYMVAEDGQTEYAHIPDWYEWERAEVAGELERGEYGFCVEVDIYMIVNTKGVFSVGSGTLAHTAEGFELSGCEGKLSYTQKSVSLYTLNSDFYWYSMGDVIGIGDHKALYYCMPREDKYIVTKARLATEEIYKRLRSQ